MGDGYPNTIGMGSAAVFWQDDEVHIANFHAYDNGFLMQSSFDGDQGWQATSTGYKVNIANPDTTQLAVSTVIVGAQGKQKVSTRHLMLFQAHANIADIRLLYKRR